MDFYMTTKTAQVLQELLRRADASEGNNRWQFKPLSDPPTITGSTTAPSSTVFNRYHSSDITGPQPWQVLGGYFRRQASEGETWGNRIVTGLEVRVGTVSAPSGLYTGRSGSVVMNFLGDELIFELEANNGSYQFLVEEDGVDRLVNVDGLGITPVGTDINDKAYYKLAWSTVKMRKITLQTNANQLMRIDLMRVGRFGGVYTKDHQIITRPRFHGPRIGGYGDSNIQGTNGPSSEGYLSVAFNELGLKDTWISAIGASGAFAGPTPDSCKWSQRRQIWQDGNLDLMVFSISWSDWNLCGEEETVGLEMTELDACRTANPGMPIVMIGLHAMPVEEAADETSPGNSTILGTNAKMKAAIESRNDPLMRYLDTYTLYETPFQGDNVSDSGHSGTPDYDVNWGWSGHYSRQGDRRIGRAIAARLYDIFRDMYYEQVTVAEEVVPALTSSSGSTTLRIGEANPIALSLGANVTLNGIASITPALPAGVLVALSGTPQRLLVAEVPAPATATAVDDYAVVFDLLGGGTLAYTLTLDVLAGTPVLSPASGSETFTVGVAKSVDLATARFGQMASYPAPTVTPALPSGISVAPVLTLDGYKLQVSGTASAAVAATSHAIVVNLIGGGTVSYTLGLTVAAVTAPSPALSSTSGSQSATVGVAKSVDLATATDCTLASIASVTPALPAGLSASVGTSGTKIHLGGTGTAVAASGSYVIVANVTGGGTLTYTLTLVVAAAPTSAFLIDVVFNGLSTDTSLTDAAGNVWIPVGGATCDGVIPSGGGFECTTPALLAAAVLGTDDFRVETVMSPTANDVTVLDFGVGLGLPMFVCNDGAGNPMIAFYSTSAGWKQASTGPTGSGSWKATDSAVSWYRDSGAIKLGFSWVGDMSWGGGADTTDYTAAPTKVTIGTRQGDATNRPFVGTITSLKVTLGS